MLREGGNPTGALFAPLALLSLLYSRKKKRGTLDTIIILVVLGMSLGLGLSACSIGGAQIAVTPIPTPGSPLPTYIINVATPTTTATYVATPNGTPVPPTVLPQCPTGTPPPTLTNAQMFYDAVMNNQGRLRPGFSPALLLAMGAWESGDFDNSLPGGVLQLRNPDGGPVKTVYTNTPDSFDANVKAALAIIGPDYDYAQADAHSQNPNKLFYFLYKPADKTGPAGPYANDLNGMATARSVLYYNGGIDWWENGYVRYPMNIPYVGDVATQLSKKPFGYSGDTELLQILNSVQNVVYCQMKDNRCQ